MRLHHGETQGVGQPERPALKSAPKWGVLTSRCISCRERVCPEESAQNDGLCWRCAEEQDYADDQAMYDDLRHGG